MPTANHALKPFSICSQCLKNVTPRISSLNASQRSFSTKQSLLEDVQTSEPKVSSEPPVPTHKPLDPSLVHTKFDERRLIKKQGVMPLGSRRMRAAKSATQNIPFEQLPYQCFQEARKVLAADREGKVKQIGEMRARIARLVAMDDAACGGTARKAIRVDSMKRELERLKVLADINDPMVKKKFEDGQGDMSFPVYRFLADRKWREYKRPILVQRITQMSVIPDVYPFADPVLEFDIKFDRFVITPGDFLLSSRSEHAPRINIQSFTAEPRLVTIVAVDSDVPNVAKDGFDYRCHGIWSNVVITPTNGAVNLAELTKEEHTILPWTPPYAQQGSPYHRISIWIFEQEGQKLVDTLALENKIKREGFVLRSFVDKQKLKAQPLGVTMFRTQWDESTANVMARHNIPGAELEFKNKKPEKLPAKYRMKDGARYRGG